MRIVVALQGVKQVAVKLIEEKKKRDANVMRAIKLASYMVQATARKSILRDPKTGIVYGKHQASAPGEAPASDTGNLARNIIVLADERTHMSYVVSRAPYSAALEYGAVRNKDSEFFTLAPRPFMRPALELNRAAIRKLIDDAKNGKKV